MVSNSNPSSYCAWKMNFWGSRSVRHFEKAYYERLFFTGQSHDVAIEYLRFWAKVCAQHGESNLLDGRIAGLSNKHGGSQRTATEIPWK